MRTFNVGGNQGRGDPVRVPITLADDEGTLSEPIRKVNVLGVLFWIGVVAFALALAAYDIALSVYWPH